MSTIVFGAVTKQRQLAEKGTSTKDKPGLKLYVDTLAALVPAEILAAHAAILSITTQSVKDAKGKTHVTITDPGVLKGSFWALVVLAVFLYAVGHGSKWQPLDWVRVLIPPLAFVGWTMIQSPTAFDATWPAVGLSARYAVAVIGAIALAAVAGILAYQADQTPPDAQRRRRKAKRGAEPEPAPPAVQGVQPVGPPPGR